VSDYVQRIQKRGISRSSSNLKLVSETEKHDSNRVGGGADAESRGELKTCQIQNSDLLKDFTEGIRGRIVEYVVYQINKGQDENGVKQYIYKLRTLMSRGANLYDPESVKAVISQGKWSNKTKIFFVCAYDSFLKFLDGSWDKPVYKPEEKLPFIPLESEIDQLIAGCSSTIATVLQTIKETGARIGEVSRILWIDVDLERKTVSINYPEKGSRPRQFKVSSKLITMLNRLPRKRETVFAHKKQLSKVFYNQRKRIAHRLDNNRLLSISFHCIRHWYATTEYHKTKNILHVMQALGHKNIKNTMIYTHLVGFEGDEYNSATAETVEEASKLVEAGFEYICEISGVQLFRKRK
jgi:integrase